jgi:hypothetical protein
VTVFDCSKRRRQAVTGLEVRRQARRERLDQRFQLAFVDNGDAGECRAQHYRDEPTIAPRLPNRNPPHGSENW